MNKIAFADVLIKLCGIALFFFSLTQIPTLFIATAPDNFAWLLIIEFLLTLVIAFSMIRYSYRLAMYLFKSTSRETEQCIDVKNNKENFLFWVKLIGLVIILNSISPFVSVIFALIVPSANVTHLTPYSIVFYLIKPILGVYLLLDGAIIVTLAYPPNKGLIKQSSNSVVIG